MSFSDDIIVKLGLDSVSFNRGLEEVAKGGEMLKRALEMVGIGLSVNEVMEFFKGVGEFAEKIRDTAEATGLTTEKVQGLQYAFKDAGNSAEDSEKYISKLSIKIGEAANGSKEARDSFEKWGVEIANASGEVYGTGEVIDEVADRMKSLESATDRSAFANDMFGKGAAHLIPILSEGREGLAAWDKQMRDTSAFMSGAAVDAWDALGKTIAEAGTTAKASSGNWMFEALNAVSKYGLGTQFGFSGDIKAMHDAIRSELEKTEATQKKVLGPTKEYLELQRKISEETETLETKKRKYLEDTLEGDEKIKALEEDIADLNEQGFDADKLGQLKIQETILEKQSEIQKIKVKLQKDENEELQKYSDKLAKLHEEEAAALRDQGDAQQALDTAKADRSHLTVNELATAQLAWNASADASNQQRTAQEIMRLEAAAQAARLAGDIGGAEGSLNAADALRAGLGMLKDNERNQFKSLEDALKKQTDHLAKIRSEMESLEIVNMA